MTDASAPSPPDIASLSFEQALAELERIVGQLESGQAELEHSIELYARGGGAESSTARGDSPRLACGWRKSCSARTGSPRAPSPADFG